MIEQKAVPIPEDLKVWYGVACDGISFKTDHEVVKALIERIAALTAELAEAREQVEVLSKPMSDEEWNPEKSGFQWPELGLVRANQIIAARLTPPASEKEPES